MRPCFLNGADNLDEEFKMLKEYQSVKEMIVISASKRLQTLFDAPVSISVITSEDIQMSGCQSLAEVLRMAPGVYVQETSGGQQDASIRGMINVPKEGGAFAAFSRNILVLIDGRSYFNDVFGGTFWEFIPITFDDIDRIEIARGPAAALYGANAVTGVVNIITKKTGKTKGLFASAGAGNKSRRFHALRYGNSYKNFSFRIGGEITVKDAYDDFSFDHTKQIYEYRYSVLAADGTPNLDYLPPFKKSLDAYRISSFFNYDLKSKGNIELQLGYSDGKFNSTGASGDLFLMGYKNMQNCVGRITYQLNDFKISISDNFGRLGTEYKKSSTYKIETDYITGDTILALDDYADSQQNGSAWNSFDIEIQNVFNISDKDKLVAGVNYRTTTARSDAQYFRTNTRNEQNFIAAYINNEYKILDNLNLILGGRYDKYNKPDKSVLSPQTVLLYKPDEDQRIRLIYSQAARAPFIADLMMDLQFSNGFTQDQKWAPLLKLSPNSDLDPMTIKSYEIGYSRIFNKILNLNLNLYHYECDDLIGYQTVVSDSPYAVAKHLTKETSAAGTIRSVNLEGRFKSNGIEAGFDYLIDGRSKIWGSYSYQNSRFNGNSSKASPEQLLSIGLNKNFKKSGWSFSASANYASGYEVSLTNVMDHTLYSTLTQAGNNLVTERYAGKSWSNVYNAYITTGAQAFEQLGGTVLPTANQGIESLLTPAEASFLGFFKEDPALIGQYKTYLMNLGLPEAAADAQIQSDTIAAGQAARAGFGSAFITSMQNTSSQSVKALMFFNLRIAKRIFNDKGEIAFAASLRPERREYPYGEKTGNKYGISLSYEF